MTNSSTGLPTMRFTIAKLRNIIYKVQNLVKGTKTSRLKLKNLLVKSMWYGKSTQDIDTSLRKLTCWKVAQPGNSELNKIGTSQRLGAR